MVHGDDNGLVLPPRVAPIQVMIVPVMQHKEGVLDKAYEIEKQLKAAGLRVKVDASDKTPGYKFADAEMRGIPLRLEIGPKDIEKGQCVLAKGYIRMMWCEDDACEAKIKEETGATSRCIKEDEEPFGDVCPICGKPAKKVVYFAKAY